MRWVIGVGCLCVAAACIAAVSVRVVAGDDNKTADPLEPYRYPKAEGGSGAAQANNLYCERLTSSDDFEKVAAFYQKKAGKELGALDPDSVQVNGSGEASIDDSNKRPVMLRTWIKHTDSYSLTVVASRTKDEKVTHIILSYWKRK
jgi:hypothetical protein